MAKAGGNKVGAQKGSKITTAYKEKKQAGLAVIKAEAKLQFREKGGKKNTGKKVKKEDAGQQEKRRCRSGQQRGRHVKRRLLPGIWKHNVSAFLFGCLGSGFVVLFR